MKWSIQAPLSPASLPGPRQVPLGLAVFVCAAAGVRDVKSSGTFILVGLLTIGLMGCGRTGSSPGNGATATSSAGQAAILTSTANSGAASSGTTVASSGSRTSANTAANAPAGSVTKVVDEVRPGVVKVDASGQAQNPGPFGLGLGNGGNGQGGGGQAQAQGTGTGVLLDDQGHILTNNHVVTLEGSSVANSLNVTLANGKTASAKVVGRDEQTDLAVIQIDKSQLSGTHALQWTDLNSVAVGEPVVAIGYALDLAGEPTVTTGVVSARNRAIDEPTATISGSIQTDAAINPGNSGGPLVDMNGHVIGINAAGLVGTPQQPAQGVNFAISAATAKPVADALIAHGQVTRGYMGVRVTNITPELAQSDKLPVTSGAGVGEVTSGSPAAQAGLQPGDIITKVGNTTIQNVGDLTTALTDNPPGAKVPVTYYRGNGQHTGDLTLASRPS
jgi:S1-C subfamily serine protease